MIKIDQLDFQKTLHWTSFLEHENEVKLEDLLKSPLLRPVEDFFRKRGKNIRPMLVELGYRLSSDDDKVDDPETKERIRKASLIIEAIHGGALIVDDIQDGSVVRRDEPTLHLKYGMPQALNVGNWLYFWALEQIKSLKLSEAQHNLLFHDCSELLSRAHLGQALDVGTKIDEIPKDKVFETSLASMELKTGTLMSLALLFGAVIANASEAKRKELDALGTNLGLILQMFDDLGNFFNPEKTYKRHEDLKLRRPTWIWARASNLNETQYANFVEAVRDLPDETLLKQWLSEDFKKLCLELPLKSLHKIMNDSQMKYSSTHPEAFSMLQNIEKLLEHSYVKKI